MTRTAESCSGEAETAENIKICGITIPILRLGTLICGSGAASLACACHLKRLGTEDLLVVTDNLYGGTSRNTGSDKQTYYKLSDSTSEPDSPYDMARALSGGGCMHGDIALIEAMGSESAFYNLVNLGVPFPHNKYGGYSGYRTDHDPAARGVSAGPYTSQMMTIRLQKEYERLGGRILNAHDVVRLITDCNRAVGALLLDKRSLRSKNFGLKLILAENTVLGLGGPAGLYENSVYPKPHTGGIGLALEAGAEAVNLTESQFGLAAVKFRWNLSGSYQQVLPRYYSTDPDGTGKRDFLLPYFNTFRDYLNAVFLKGYQWPFNSAELKGGGSSLIDLLVYIETELKGRRVFLDYRVNPPGRPDWNSFSRSEISAEALNYLDRSDAWAETPIKRLEKLNPDSISMFRTHGIDMYIEPLEAALSAQHNNGGLSADIWWESVNISRLFPVGEINGTHGVSRPGGSALTSGQVGARRAAERIAAYGSGSAEGVRLSGDAERQIESVIGFIKKVTDRVGKEGLSPEEFREEYRKRMSRFGGAVRRPELIRAAVEASANQFLSADAQTPGSIEILPLALKNRHMALTQLVYLSAIEFYLSSGGGSRGSCLVQCGMGERIHPLLENEWRLRTDNNENSGLILTTRIKGSCIPDSEPEIINGYTECRPIPDEEFWFETVWADYKSGGIFSD